ncbi:MAG: response regulator transcription factor [Cyanobacteria bacterium P01_F01_bin.86]
MSETINVLLVDDQALLRQALENLLTQNADLKIVGTASDGHEAIKQVALCRPDVVLLDIEMPNLDGLSATRLITQRFPETKVILLSAYDNDAYLMNGLKAGAKAYLLKDTLSGELTDTIRNVYKGYGQFSPGILEKMVAGIAKPEELLTEDIAEVGSSAKVTGGDILEFPQKQPVTPVSSTSQPVALPSSASMLALDQFNPDDLRKLLHELHSHSETASAVKPVLEERIAEEPTNLAALYVYGVMARQTWNEPQKAFASLQAGFQAGMQQKIAPEALLIFYREALPLDASSAFSWLTQVGSPWNKLKRLPFLIQEAAKQFGRGSSQYRSLLLLYRIRFLKMMLSKTSAADSGHPETVSVNGTSALLSAL